MRFAVKFDILVRLTSERRAVSFWVKLEKSMTRSTAMLNAAYDDLLRWSLNWRLGSSWEFFHVNHSLQDYHLDNVPEYQAPGIPDGARAKRRSRPGFLKTASPFKRKYHKNDIAINFTRNQRHIHTICQVCTNIKMMLTVCS